MNDPTEVYRKEVKQRILMARTQGGWEGSHTDFKLESGTKIRNYAKLIKHLLAFANTPRSTDAYVIFGVHEDKHRSVFEHVGITGKNFLSKETIEQLIHEYTRLQNTFVDAHFSLDDKWTPYIVIPMQYEGPQTVTRTMNPGPGALSPGEIFWRYGSRSVRATPRDVTRMQSDWGTWFLDGRYEENATALLNSLKTRFPKYLQLQDIGPCIRLVYNTSIDGPFGKQDVLAVIHAYWGFDPVGPASRSRDIRPQVASHSPWTERRPVLGFWRSERISGIHASVN
jgi:hypothetical protein